MRGFFWWVHDLPCFPLYPFQFCFFMVSVLLSSSFSLANIFESGTVTRWGPAGLPEGSQGLHLGGQAGSRHTPHARERGFGSQKRTVQKRRKQPPLEHGEGHTRMKSSVWPRKGRGCPEGAQTAASSSPSQFQCPQLWRNPHVGFSPRPPGATPKTLWHCPKVSQAEGGQSLADSPMLGSLSRWLV